MTRENTECTTLHYTKLHCAPLHCTTMRYNANIQREGTHTVYMKKGYPIILAVLVLTVGLAVFEYEKESSPLPEEPFTIPRENVYVGSVVFSPEPLLVGGERENGEQIKRVGGLYIVRLTNEVLIVEIYAWGTRTLFKKEVYTLSELKQRYPEGVSIWVEQDRTSALVIFVPWQ